MFPMKIMSGECQKGGHKTSMNQMKILLVVRRFVIMENSISIGLS